MSPIAELGEIIRCEDSAERVKRYADWRNRNVRQSTVAFSVSDDESSKSMAPRVIDYRKREAASVLGESILEVADEEIRKEEFATTFLYRVTVIAESKAPAPATARGVAAREGSDPDAPSLYATDCGSRPCSKCGSKHIEVTDAGFFNVWTYRCQDCGNVDRRDGEGAIVPEGAKEHDRD